MWIVTWENKRTGEWVSDPEGPFRRKKDAVKYIKDIHDVLLPDNLVALYRCELISQTSDYSGPEFEPPGELDEQGFPVVDIPPEEASAKGTS